MIIFQTPSSDTFVTNMNNLYNKGENANFGKASTIDLFKLYNENSNSYSKSIILISSIPDDGETFSFVDSDSKETKFVFSIANENEDGNLKNEEGFVVIGILNVGDSTEILCQRIFNTISALKERKEINIDIFSYKSRIVLLQTKKGKEGDKDIEVNTESISLLTGNKFVRLDYSVGLIKFSIEEFLNDWATNGNRGAFDNLTAILNLKDVSTGLSKPKNYELSIYALKKSFLEGLGKDIVNFSDVDYANFVNINDSESWSIPGMFIMGEDVDLEPIDSFYVSKGNEDIKFNISSYVLDRINENLAERIQDDFGFLITFSESFLYNEKSYFAKRLGSRHLLNKSLVPTLEFKINDSDYIKIDKSNYNFEDSNKLIDFYFESKNIDPPLGFQNLNAKVEYLNIVTKEYEVISGDLLATNSISNLIDYKGSTNDKVLKASLQFSSINIPEIYSNLDNKGVLTLKVTWFWEDEEKNNTLNIFNETKTVDFSFTARSNISKKEYLTIEFDRELSGDNSEYQISVNILDPKANHDFVKTPYQLSSIDLGDICYRIYDVQTGKTLIDFDSVATKLIYDGKSYVGNVFIGDIMKNKVLNFEFKVINSRLTNKIIKNLKMGFKVN